MKHLLSDIILADARPRLLILYGSQTGNAADAAERIRRAAKRRHYQPALFALDDYDRTRLIEEKLVIFIVSTTGQGEEPDNMKKFWRFLLRKDLPRDALYQMQYSVFGLGDSSYEKYNYPAKKLYKRLQQLGGHPFYVRGDGDDQHYLGFPITFVDKPPPCHSVMDWHSGDYHGQLTKNERITATDHFQDVRLVELSFEQLPPFQPGDILDIMPENRIQDVDAFLDYIGLLNEADRSVQICATDRDYPLPTGLNMVLTLRQLCQYWLDIFSVPRRSFFELTAHFAQDPEHAEKLEFFSSAEGQDDLYAYCYRMRRTAFEILEDFNSIKIPLDYLLEIFPLLRRRSFSIASSPQVHQNSIQLLIGIVKYRTRLSTPRSGVFTPPIALPVWIRRGTLRLPSTGPIILIAPGLGLAPMRSLLEERVITNQHDNILIFGCRHEKSDFYFKDEWKTMCTQNALQLFTAFSRDQDDKRYVQQVIREQASLIWTTIYSQQGFIYVCGKSTRMPEDVADAFCELFIEQGHLSPEEARTLITTLKRTGRYQQECWD
ncbi:hypothetical protein BDF19DRAFT_472185 [Syncephalis fuscata]|nr:hypothetical protein BDF19DRAFT_472185 [Syncephalis fuscata]